MARVISVQCRNDVYAKTGGRCWYCGIRLVLTENPTIPGAACLDHATPKEQGGSNHPDNLLPSCRRCNSRKSRKTIEEYRSYLQTKAWAEWRAARLLEQAVAECKTPYDDVIHTAIQWLETQIQPTIFWGETPH